jgi:hypothetical protein
MSRLKREAAIQNPSVNPISLSKEKKGTKKNKISQSLATSNSGIQ